ncbi:MAG: hypothetical protein MJZ00_05575, partial [Paludibacteraceae bacterium]|nr:hypothetical protein [Paludibacteraceae bacterium]
MGKRVFLQALFLCLCLCANAIDYTRDDYYVRQYGSGSGDGSSWDDAMNCESFATALGMVKDGATFHIASGVYIPTCDKNYNKSAESQNKVFHTKKAVNLIGGYSWNPQNGETPDPQNNKTVFSGDIKGNDYSSKADNSYNVISYELSRPSKILISGIEMKATQTAKDKNDGMLSVTSDINQNGIKIDVSVDKCVFHDGSSAFSFLGGDMDVLVSQCEIYNNANAWTNFYGNIRLESCAIYNNSIVKVDPYLYEREIVSKYSFVNCSFHKNKTISVETYIASVDLYNNTIVGDDISLLVRKADLNCVGNIIKASAINIDNLSNVAHNLFSNAVDKQVMATLSEKSNVFLEKAFSLLSDTLAYNGGFTKSFMLSGYSVGSEYLKFPLSKTVVSKDQCGVDRCDITCMGSFEYKKKLVGMNYEISVGEQLDGQTYDKAGLYKVILNEMSGSECREKIGKLLVKPDVSVKKYYVKVNGSGSGDGSSWENALSGKAFIDYYQYADTEVTFYIAEGIYLPFSDKFTLVSGISYDRYVPERKKHVHIVGGFRKNITDEKEAPDPTKYHTVFHSDINDDDNVISEDESLEFSNRGDNVSSYFNIFFQEEGMSSFDGIHFVGNVNACLGFKCPKKVENVSVSISNCSFTNCDKLINLTGNVKLDFSNCRFSYVKDFPSCMNLTVNNCSFTHIVNGFTLTDGELKMTNSTFVDIKKTLLDCADSASAVLYNNTIIVPNKECVMDLPKKTSLEGNLLSFAKIGFSDGSYITSDHNIYSVSNEYMGKKDIVIPAISFSEFLSGDVSDGTFIPSVEHYNSLVDVVPLTKHVLANGYSLRFHRIFFIDTDQRGVERIDSTCIGAYEFHCTDTVKVVKVDTSYLGKYYYGQQLLKLGMNSVEYDSVNALGCKRTVFHKVYVLPCDDSLYVDGVDTTYLGKIYYGQEMQRLGMNTVEIDTVNERECKRTVFHKVYVLPCDDSLYVDGVDTTYLGKFYYGQEMQRLGMNTVEIEAVNERECKRTVFHKVYVLPCDDSLYV